MIVENSLKIMGMDELERKMRLMGKDIAERHTNEMLKTAGKVLAIEMRARVPRGSGAKASKRLIDSIGVKLRKDKESGERYVTAGAYSFYALMVHDGHRIRVPRKGYGYHPLYWSGYIKRGMYGQFLPQTVPGHPFVAEAMMAKADEAIYFASEYLAKALRDYESRAAL